MGVVTLSEALKSEKGFVQVPEEATISTHALLSNKKENLLDKEIKDKQFKKAFDTESDSLEEFDNLMLKTPDELRAMASSLGVVNPDKYIHMDKLVKAIMKKTAQKSEE